MPRKDIAKSLQKFCQSHLFHVVEEEKREEVEFSEIRGETNALNKSIIGLAILLNLKNNSASAYTILIYNNISL